MVKALVFKGDPKTRTRKRKRTAAGERDQAEFDVSSRCQEPVADESHAPEEADTWTSADILDDIRGPIVIALPTNPHSALSCDANGFVFTLPLENVVEGNLLTAEPHDVRQVWIANQVAGTGNFSFKGHHGKYLACDLSGDVSATRDAVGVRESFRVVTASEGRGLFMVQTAQDKFLTVKGIGGIGETFEVNKLCAWRIRVQAGFTTRVRAGKEEKARERVSRRELEKAAGRALEDEEVRRLKKAKKEGSFREAILDVRTRKKHDKFG